MFRNSVEKIKKKKLTANNIKLKFIFAIKLVNFKIFKNLPFNL